MGVCFSEVGDIKMEMANMRLDIHRVMKVRGDPTSHPEEVEVEGTGLVAKEAEEEEAVGDAEVVWKKETDPRVPPIQLLPPISGWKRISRLYLPRRHLPCQERLTPSRCLSP